MRRLHRGPVGAEKRSVIDSALRAARAGEPVDGHLELLGFGPPPAPPSAGDPEDLEEGESHRVSHRPTRVPDSAPRTLPGYHICPQGVCERQERRAADGERPVCAVFDLALRFVAEA
ncbi:hypothetical protein ACGFSB_07660 [Streptomyces sp. NPDC048441]|uniref:hypothetical protein n=1 Tax=Streptomyces sp. NPDC048441 TaxID=3365552 RepID=UPI003713D05A